MATEFKVTPKRTGRTMSFEGKGDKFKIAWTITYNVQVIDKTSSSYFVTDVSDVDVVTAPGLPVVNRTVYSYGGKIIPYVICRNKKATQNSENASLWEVTAEFDSGESNNRNESNERPVEPPAKLTDLQPKVEPFVEEEERVRYTDLSEATEDEPDNPKPLLTPTGNWYAEPFIQRLGVLTLKITQYEPSITYAEMVTRHFRTNKTEYRGEERYRWYIEKVEATEVDILLKSGTTTAAMVTYLLKRSNHPKGWRKEVALIDTHYFVTDESGEFVMQGGRKVKRAFVDDQQYGHTVGLIDKDGKRKSGMIPDTVAFELMRDLEFNHKDGGFLRA